MSASPYQWKPGRSAGSRSHRHPVTSLIGVLVAVWALAGRPVFGAETAPAAAPTTETATSPAASQPSATDIIIQLQPRLTGDGDPATRKQAAFGILQTESPEGVSALLNILNLKNNTAAKLAICEALADLDTPPPVFAEPLLALMEQPETALSDAAIKALARFQDPNVVERYRDFLERQEHEKTRTELVKRTKEIYSLLPKGPERVARLLTWLKGPLALDRQTALEIIQEAMLGTTPTPPTAEVLAQVRTMLGDPDATVRQRVVMVLRVLGEKEDAARIRAAIPNERSPIVLEEIYRALGRMSDLDAVPACIEGLKHASARVAAGAADALGRLCNKNGTRPATEVMATVVHALVDKAATPMTDPLLRGDVIEAMSDIADEQFLPVLVAHAAPEEKVPGIRQAAITGIGRIGNSAQIDLVLARLSDDPDPGVRQAAAEALGKLGSQRAHLAALRTRLDPKIEPVAAVQNRAWDSYRLIFPKLPLADQRAVLDTWAGDDRALVSRRIDLLTDLEKQAAAAGSESQRIISIREELGDAYVLAGQDALASGVFARALELLPADPSDHRSRLTLKLMDAYLKNPAIEKAIALAAAVNGPPLKTALVERLLVHARNLHKIDPKVAQELVDTIAREVPDLFGAEWAAKFQQLRQPATQPASTRPANQ